MQSPRPSLTFAPRRWLRFSLRSFLLFCLIASLGLAWWLKPPSTLNDSSIAVALRWDVKSGQNVVWSRANASYSLATPRIAYGKVFIGGNNYSEDGPYVPRFPTDVDLGVLLCFDETDGRFLWQHSNAKLPTGRVHDWPMMGVFSRPWVEKERLWYVNNRSELVCLDTDGFHDRRNDGPFVSEPNEDPREADVVWLVDLKQRLGSAPHNSSCCDVAVEGNHLFVVTPLGVDEAHWKVQTPQAPSFTCFDKRDGRLLWSDASASPNINHAQWGSPVLARIGRRMQVLMPGGDGWLYSFDPRGDGKGAGKLLWKFDCNPKTSLWKLSGRGTRNTLIADPAVHRDLVYIAVGQDPEHGEGGGHLWCIDPTKRGDVSSELVFNQAAPDQPIPFKRQQACVADDGDFVRPNPNSALVWHFSGADSNGDGALAFVEEFHRSLSSPAFKDDLLFIADCAGLFHCLDAQTGKPHWTYDLLAGCWSSPVVAGDHVYIADEDGQVAVFRCSADPNVAMVLGEPHMEIDVGETIMGVPVASGGTLYLPTLKRLYAIREK